MLRIRINHLGPYLGVWTQVLYRGLGKDNQELILFLHGFIEITFFFFTEKFSPPPRLGDSHRSA